MDGPFREMRDVLGENEREEAAIRSYGQWQTRLRTIVITIFTIGGLIPGGIAYYYVIDDEFTVRASMLFASMVWLAVILIGAWLSKQLVRARSKAKVAELAASYEVPVEAIAATVDLALDL